MRKYPYFCRRIQKQTNSKYKMKKTLVMAAAASVLLFTACSKSTESTESTEAVEEVVVEETPAADATAAEAAVLEISGDDAMKFDKTTLNAKAGQPVKLTLSHSGKLPAASMGHNFVLLKSGVDVAAFATKAIGAKDTDYIPADAAGDIIAHTKLIGGGESDTIEFTAPEAGTYTFICSFPGHSAMMKGEFVVE